MFRKLFLVLVAVASFSVAVVPATPAEAITSSETAELQRWLIAKGFLRDKADGVYGTKTAQAVMAFRKEIGVTRSFSWSSSLMGRLQAYVKPWTPQRWGQPDRFEVNLTRQVAYLFRGGRLEGVFPIASGNGDTYLNSYGDLVRAYTPTGSYTFYLHRDPAGTGGWHYSYLGGLYKPWYFSGGYAIHGSTSVPAQPASHGCVRLTTWDADWLQSRLFVGMPIHIWYEPSGVGPSFQVTYEPERPSMAPEEGSLIGDFNGNGLDARADFDPSSGNWTVEEWNGDSKVWTSFTTRDGWSEHLVGDFTGDGRDDLASYHGPTGKWIVSVSTGSSFQNRVFTQFASRDGWVDHLVGDYNGDGRDDIASYHEPTGNWVVSLSWGSSFTNRLFNSFVTRTDWSAHLVGDYTGDGRADIASFHEPTGKWFVQRSTGSAFQSRSWNQFVTRSGWRFLTGDVNGDGRADVVSHHKPTGKWIVSTSSGYSFSNRVWSEFATLGGWETPFVADLNSDGKDDVAIHHDSGPWWALMSRGYTFTNVKWTSYPPR